MKSILAIFLPVLLFAYADASAQIADHVVLSEIYGGGGNSGAIFRNDYVELYNPTSGIVDISRWSVQYASGPGSTWTVNAFGESASIAPRTFFLIRLASGGVNGDSLPQADALGTSNLSATGGKIALVSATIPLSGTNPVDSTIVDMIGYGSTSSAYEGLGPAPGGSSTTSLERKAQSSSRSETMAAGGSDEFKGNGWDGNDNGNDILQRSGPQPQNSSANAEYPPTENQPPIISLVGRSPFIPSIGSADSVYAIITDDGNIQSALLHVRVNGGSFDSSVCFGILTGTTYYAVIPATMHSANGNLVEYFISATDDSSGYSSTINEIRGYFAGESPIYMIKSNSPSAVAKYSARISGTINSNTNLFQSDAGFLQDNSGGLRFITEGLPFLKEGRNIIIEGTLRYYNGGFELTGPDFSIIDTSSGASAITPVRVELPLNQSASDSNEGRVVEIQSLITDSTGIFAAGKSYLFRDPGDDTLTIRIESNGYANTLVGKPISANPVNAAGVLVFNNTYLELRPRSAADMGMREGDGTGTATIAPVKRLINTAAVSETLTVTGDGSSILEGVSFSVPSDWAWDGDNCDVVLSGPGYSDAVKSVTGDGSAGNPWLITITGASVTNTAVGTAIICGLRTPSTAGICVFGVKTRVMSGVLSEISISPAVLISENTFEAIVSGNWTSPSTWSGGVVPDSLDDVTITTPDVVVTIDGKVSCADLLIRGVDTVGGQVGPLLQFDSTGLWTLTVNGRLELSGGVGGGGGSRGGRPKLTSNGNAHAVLNVFGSVYTNVSNTVDRGSAGLNMNEGTVCFLGSTNDTLRNGAGLRLANLIIGDGIAQKQVMWVATGVATLYIRSLLIKSGSEMICGGTTYSTTNAIGNNSSSGLPMLTGGITLENGAALTVNNTSGGKNSAAINLKGGGIMNNGTLNLRSPDGSRSYSVCFGELSADPDGSRQTIGGSSVGTYDFTKVGRLDTIILNTGMRVLDTMLLKGELVENRGSTVVGAISTLRKIVQGEENTCGGIGLILNALGASPDTTYIYRTTGIAQQGGLNSSILRYYDIIAKENTGLNASMICGYDSSELDGQDASSLSLWRSVDNGLSWHDAGGSVNTAQQRIYISGIQSFSRWTIADAEHPLESSGQSYYADPGWNMVSVPLIVSDYCKSVLYPDAASEAFLFNGRYEAQDTLCNGIGYWIKFSEKDTVILTGTEYLSDTVSLTEGWNMVGCTSRPATVDLIAEIPSGVIGSRIFGYSGTYIQVDTLLPGKAYWLKTNAAGQIILNAIPQTGYTAIGQTPEDSRLQSITFTDARGSTRELFFGSGPKSEYLMLSYDLPPVPPEDCFDVRFESNRYLEIFDSSFANGMNPVKILIRGAAFPLALEWNISNKSSGSYSLKNCRGDIIELSGKGKRTVDNVTYFTLIRKSIDRLRSDFSLSEAYPNPFNSATKVSFAIGQMSFVTLKVYDILGRELTTLVRELKQPGIYFAQWDGNNYPSGIYYYKLTAGNYTDVKKMMHMK